MRILIILIAATSIILGISLSVRSCRTEQPTIAPEKVESVTIQKEEMTDSNAIAISRGKQIFEANCTSCHKLDNKLIGPPLKGVRQRWNNDDKLYDFVMHPDKYIGKDPYVKKLQQESGGAIMAVPQLTLDEVKDIFLYLDKAGKSAEPEIRGY